LSAQWGKTSLWCRARIDLWPALQQADTLPTEPRRTITEPRRTIFFYNFYFPCQTFITSSAHWILHNFFILICIWHIHRSRPPIFLSVYGNVQYFMCHHPKPRWSISVYLRGEYCRVQANDVIFKFS
jgi:hypothetical protein